jgi:IS605 OrfB family transposase
VTLVFDVFPEDFDGSSTNRAKEKSARPEGAAVFSIKERTKTVNSFRGAFTFERAYESAQDDGRRITNQHMDVVTLSIPVCDFAVVRCCNLVHNGTKKISLLRSEYMPTKFSTKNNVHGQVINTVTSTIKVKIPDTLAHRLDSLHMAAKPCVENMLKNRRETSTKFYRTIPSILAKSLSAKYQRNPKCRSVKSLVLPVCGDKERIIKLVEGGVRIFGLFKDALIPVRWPRPVVADEQGRRNVSVEFFQRGGEWFATFSFKTPTEETFIPTGTVGVDRNSVGAVATMADPQTGKVLHLGFNPAPTKKVWGGRKANLQRQGRKRLLHRVRQKQSRRTKYENHRVSRAIVDYAATHRRAIVLEELQGVRKQGSRIKGYVERSQWSFYQLQQFIQYKAALRGVTVIEAEAAYSSQECSRCRALNKPAGKRYACTRCGHNDHRDANAAFVLSRRAMPIGGVAWESECPRSALLVEPFPGHVSSILGTESVTI